MGGYVKKGPKAKPKKDRKAKFARLDAISVPRGKNAKARRGVMGLVCL